MSQAPRWIAFLISAALLATACGSGDSSEQVIQRAEQADEPTEVPEASESAASSSTASSGDEPQTLSDYLGGAGAALRGTGFGGAFDSNDQLEEQRLVQQEIQRCMQAQGFAYVPEEVGTGIRFLIATEQSTVPPMEYAETKGFGISTAFDELLEGDLDAQESVDPNEEHLATLSEGEADAWQLALRGAPPQRNDQGQLIDPETGEVIQGGRGLAAGGCTGDAQVTVRGDFSALSEIEDELTDLTDRIAADPRITEISRDWVACMADGGFDYQDEAEARGAIRSQVQPLLRSFFTGTGNQGDGGQGGGGRGNPLQALAGLELTNEQELELDALQDLERAVAVASLECQGDTQAEIAEITARYEAEFIEENRAVLEALGS